MTDTKELIERVIREVAELPDRNSPEDWPEAMLVTADELSAILADALEAAQRTIAGMEAECVLTRRWIEATKGVAINNTLDRGFFEAALELDALLPPPSIGQPAEEDNRREVMSEENFFVCDQCEYLALPSIAPPCDTGVHAGVEVEGHVDDNFTIKRQVEKAMTEKTALELAREGLAIAEKAQRFPIPPDVRVDADDYATLCRKLIEVAEFAKGGYHKSLVDILNDQ